MIDKDIRWRTFRDRGVVSNGCVIPSENGVRELLETGNLSDKTFKTAEEVLDRKRLVTIVHTIRHFCTTAMMANVVGCTPPDEAVSTLIT